MSWSKKQLSRPQNRTDGQGCGIKKINRPEKAGCRRWKSSRTPAVEMCRCGPSVMLLLDVPKSHAIHFVQQFLHCPLQNCQQQQFITTQSLQWTHLTIPNIETVCLNNCFLHYILLLQQMLSGLSTQYSCQLNTNLSQCSRVPWSSVCLAVCAFAVRREWYQMIKL